MEKDDLVYQLRLEIKAQLSKVTKANSPAIYAAIHNADGGLDFRGYARLEGLLIQKIIAGHLAPAGAVPQLEQELDLM